MTASTFLSINDDIFTLPIYRSLVDKKILNCTIYNACDKSADFGHVKLFGH